MIIEYLTTGNILKTYASPVSLSAEEMEEMSFLFIGGCSYFYVTVSVISININIFVKLDR